MKTLWARQCDLEDGGPAIFVSTERVEGSGYVVPFRADIDRALKLLKQAGDNLDIRTSQEVRALRFKILQFLEEQDEH